MTSLLNLERREEFWRPVHIAREVEVHLRQKRTSLDQKEYWWTQAQEEKEHRRKCNEGNRDFFKGRSSTEKGKWLFIYYSLLLTRIQLYDKASIKRLSSTKQSMVICPYYPWTVPILKGLLPGGHQQEWMQVIQTDRTICDILIYTDALYGGSWPQIHCYLLLPFVWFLLLPLNSVCYTVQVPLHTGHYIPLTPSPCILYSLNPYTLCIITLLTVSKWGQGFADKSGHVPGFNFENMVTLKKRLLFHSHWCYYKKGFLERTSAADGLGGQMLQ